MARRCQIRCARFADQAESGQRIQGRRHRDPLPPQNVISRASLCDLSSRFFPHQYLRQQQGSRDLSSERGNSSRTDLSGQVRCAWSDSGGLLDRQGSILKRRGQSRAYWRGSAAAELSAVLSAGGVTCSLPGPDQRDTGSSVSGSVAAGSVAARRLRSDRRCGGATTVAQLRIRSATTGVVSGVGPGPARAGAGTSRGRVREELLTGSENRSRDPCCCRGNMREKKRDRNVHSDAREDDVLAAEGIAVATPWIR